MDFDLSNKKRPALLDKPPKRQATMRQLTLETWLGANPLQSNERAPLLPHLPLDTSTHLRTLPEHSTVNHPSSRPLVLATTQELVLANAVQSEVQFAPVQGGARAEDSDGDAGDGGDSSANGGGDAVHVHGSTENVQVLQLAVNLPSANPARAKRRVGNDLDGSYWSISSTDRRARFAEVQVVSVIRASTPKQPKQAKPKTPKVPNPSNTAAAAPVLAIPQPKILPTVHSSPKKPKREELLNELDGSYWSPSKSEPAPRDSTAGKLKLVTQNTPQASNQPAPVVPHHANESASSDVEIIKVEVHNPQAERDPYAVAWVVGSGIGLDGSYWKPASGKRSSISTNKFVNEMQSLFMSMWKAKPRKAPPRVLTEEEKQRYKEQREMKRKAELEERDKRQEAFRMFIERKKVGHEIVPGVFVGSQLTAENGEWMRATRIGKVLNLTSEIENHFEGYIAYKRLHFADSNSENLQPHIPHAVEFIASARTQEHLVLVHCREGRSRSPTIVAAYAMAQLRMPLKQVYERLKETLVDLNINDGFKLQLMQLERDLLGSQTLDFFSGRMGME
jgi:dual specificity phosphatase 3